MEALTDILVFGGIACAVVVGVAKTIYDLRRLATQPARRRQPWECEPRLPHS
jgi:hypothetical protein